MLKRVVSAVALLAITALCFLLCTETAVAYVAVCGILCCHEMANGLKKLNKNPVRAVPFIFIVASALVIYFKLPVIWLAAVVLALFVATFVFCMKAEKRTASDALATLEMMIYPSLPVIGVVFICCMPDSKWIIILLTGLLSAISCDTFALFGGMAFGKHKLAPTVSPKKTIEGSISGMVVTIGVGIGAWFLFKDKMLVELWQYIIIVTLCTVTSQIGDLSASFIKREAGIKDFGNLIPGHGGMLDRIDSIIFSVPTAYILTELFSK